MPKTVHIGASPSVEVENQIIDKKPSKWESVLLYLIVFVLLLPTAAQSITSGFLALTFLIPRSWRFIPWAETVPKYYRTLIKTLFIVWGLLALESVLQAYRYGDASELKLYVRLIGKQGVWGSVVMLAMIFARTKRPKSFIRPLPLIIFAALLLVYCLFQRYTGIDWVHGFHAVLGENRRAYGIYRVSGWMDHPLTFAFNLMLFSLTTFAHGLWSWKRSEIKEARLWFIQTAILLALFVLTDSRFPFALTIFLMVGAVVWEAPKLRRFLLGGTGVCLLLLVGMAIVLPHESFGRWGELLDGNVAIEQRFDRIIFWKVNWQLFLQDPWLGSGLAHYEPRLLDTYLQAGYTSLERKYNAHNIYLQSLVDGGMLGGMGLAILLGSLGRLAFVVHRRFDHLAIPLVFLATLGGGLVQNHLRDAEYLFALWTCIGLSLSWLLVQGNENEPRPSTELQDLQSGQRNASGCEDVRREHASSTQASG